MTWQEILHNFLDFFRSKYHHILPSAPIVIRSDPTLMFVNSGMNPFKEYFVGKKKIIFDRKVSIQKCLRVSGKHNDLEDVGKDSYHHTMFEMLGNWSFGYCVKKQAIAWVWELLITIYQIPIDNIYVTIFSGETKEGISLDEESHSYWENFLKNERIIYCLKKHNFWEMSNIGPCGPSSEIHVDLRSNKEKKKISGKKLINKNHHQVIELWNLVFMEFFRHFDGSLEKLSERHIDTGLGFERLCRVLQNKNSNYDTDIFSYLIRKVEEISHTIYGRNIHTDIAIRVIVDHIRAILFAIADGQNISAAGAGYVIRRLIRRALSYGYRFLKKEAFIYQLVEILITEMSSHYPELISKNKWIEEKIFYEENYFLNTLHKGMKRLENIIKETKDKKQKSITGIIIFELYNTYGFPIDISQLLVAENALVIDKIGFEKELNFQKARSRLLRHFQTNNWIFIKEINKDFINDKKLSIFIQLSKYRLIKKNITIYYHIVFTTTPFTGEKVGQVGDKGVIENEKETISILDTKKDNNIFLHIANNIPKSPEKIFRATIDKFRRKAIEKNHSATHLLHYALSIILNDVFQQDADVSPDNLRFYFSHAKKLTKLQIKNIEGIIQEIIFQDLPIKESIAHSYILNQGSKEREKNIRFGPTVKLCEGFHVKRTGEIGGFKILSESYVGSGVRRIEAVTSKLAINYLNNIQEKYNFFEETKIYANPYKYMVFLQQENKMFINKLETIRLKDIQVNKTDWLFNVKYHNNYNIISEKTDLDFKGIKTIVLELRRQNIQKNMIIIIGSTLDTFICIAISSKLVDIYDMNACKILKKVSTNIYSEMNNKELAIAKVENIRELTDYLKVINNYNDLYSLINQ